MTLSVSMPEASPPICRRATTPSLLLERPAGDHGERLRGRDRAQHVAVEVADLDHHPVRVGVAREVQLALLRAQLLVAPACGLHLLEHLDRRTAGHGIDGRAGHDLEIRLGGLRGARPRARLDSRQRGWVLRSRRRYLHAHPTIPPGIPTEPIPGLPRSHRRRVLVRGCRPGSPTLEYPFAALDGR